jgi:hypothetical protein
VQPGVQRADGLDVTSLFTPVPTDDNLVCNQVAGSIPVASIKMILRPERRRTVCGPSVPFNINLSLQTGLATDVFLAKRSSRAKNPPPMMSDGSLGYDGISPVVRAEFVRLAVRLSATSQCRISEGRIRWVTAWR